MNRQAEAYEWHMIATPIRQLWQEPDIIYFKDPNRPSTDPAFMSSHARDSKSGSPSPHPDADDPLDPSVPAGQNAEQGE
jgi:hypothetical protein